MVCLKYQLSRSHVLCVCVCVCVCDYALFGQQQFLTQAGRQIFLMLGLQLLRKKKKKKKKNHG